MPNLDTRRQRQEVTVRGFFKSRNWNEYNLNTLTRINWRASLVPAAAVIPAPIAYINAAAVETLVVGFLDELLSRTLSVL